MIAITYRFRGETKSRLLHADLAHAYVLSLKATGATNILTAEVNR